jgi:transposase
VAVEEVPCGNGKRTLTKAYMLFLALGRGDCHGKRRWAFRTSWDKVFDAVEHVVTFGLEHRVLGQIDAIGVDEIQYAKGHKYLTLVYQIDLDVTRLLWVAAKEPSNPFGDFSPLSATNWLRRLCSSAPTCGNPTCRGSEQQG